MPIDPPAADDGQAAAQKAAATLKHQEAGPKAARTRKRRAAARKAVQTRLARKQANDIPSPDAPLE